MKANEVYTKTLKFAWIKLGMGLATVLLSIILFAIVMGISVLMESEEVGMIGLLIWFAGTLLISYIINTYFGYLVKAGHVAVIAETFRTGQVPADEVNYGIRMVKSRFATSNIYFVLDRLVSGAVNQLQSAVGKVESFLDFVSGMSIIAGFAKSLIRIGLGYVDECCLGYTFYNNQQSAFKSAADGVVIYFQNWKTLLKDAAKVSLIVIIGTVVASILPVYLFVLLFKALGWFTFIGFVVGVIVGCVVRYAFIDSYILVRMMSSYMQVAPTTVISFDLYGKLSRLSGKFRELCKRAGNEIGNAGMNNTYSGNMAG